MEPQGDNMAPETHIVADENELEVAGLDTPVVGTTGTEEALDAVQPTVREEDMA